MNSEVSDIDRSRCALEGAGRRENISFKFSIEVDIIQALKVSEPKVEDDYLATVENTGAEGHLLSPEELAFMHEAGVFSKDPVRAAQEVLIVEQLKELLA